MKNLKFKLALLGASVLFAGGGWAQCLGDIIGDRIFLSIVD